MKSLKPKDLQIIAFALLLLFLLTLQIISGSENAASKNLSFQIVEGDGVTPVSNVHIKISMNGKVIYQSVSDLQGRFSLPPLEIENLTLEISAQGFATERLVGQKLSTTTRVIQLLKAGVLKGKVITKKSGKPVPGAKLNLWGPDGQIQTSTDPEGVFYFGELRSGDYTLTLKVTGYGVPSVERIQIGGGDTIERNFELSEGSLITGRILDRETNQPLRNISVSLYGNQYYQDYTDRNGFFSFANVNPGTYQLSFYHEGFNNLPPETVEIQEGQSQLNKVYSLEPLPPQFQIYTYQQVFMPRERVEIHLRSYRLFQLDCKLYRISIRDLRSAKSQWLQKPATLLKDKVPFSKWTKKIDIQDLTRWQLRTIQFPLTRKGFYVLQLTYKDTQKYVPFFYTEMGIIAKASPDSVLVWTHKLSNSEPVAGAQIEMESQQYTADSSTPSRAMGSSDQNGLLQFSNLTDGSYHVWAFQGEDAAYAELYSGSQQNQDLKAYIYTDRPVYRPGHMVHYKGILRREKGDVYEVVAGFTCPLTIRDATGTILQQTNITTNDHGSFSGDFKLTDEPALGTYQIEVQTGGTPSGQFKVLEYRKPEFEIKVLPDQPRYMNGDTIQAKIVATYYFGAPVSNQKINYSVLDAPYYSWNYYDEDNEDEGYEYEYEDYYGYGRVITTGSVQLDANGEASISFPATRDNYDRYYNIEAKISDESRREVTGRGKVLITRGEYKVGVFTDSYVFNAGEKISFQLKTTDYDDKPVGVNVKVDASFCHWDTKTYRYNYVSEWSEEVHTDPKGVATFSYQPPKSGYVRVNAVVEDSKGNKIDSCRYVWIAGADDEYDVWYNQRTLDLIPDKKQKEPGEQAKVLINSSKSNVYALVTFEGSKVYKAEVIQLKGHTKLITFPALAQYAPTLYVSVSFTAQKQYYNRAIAFQINPSHNFLKIQISADKTQYKPRETASYLVQITDPKGNPVQTEFSLSLVDESIYAISPELAPDIQKFFYGPRPNRVVTYYSFPPRYLGGADKEGNKQIRKDFPDTAFWTASAQTDAHGTARLQIKLPDSLTTWRATVRAANDETKVGSAVQKIITAKTLIARLETPRFFTVDDSLLITGVVHNLSAQSLNVRTELNLDEKLQLQEEQLKSIRLAAQEIQRIDWKIRVLKSGTTRVVLKADASTDFDGMQLDIPVLPFGLEKMSSFSGQTDTTSTTKFNLATPDDLPTAHLKLYFTPSMAGIAFESLEYLTGYPYGCVEQTMSRFLPDVVVAQALKRLHSENPKLSQELPDQINAGLQRLYHFQHEDGGWGWWENDETHPYMTAYVIYGLSLSKEAGFAIDESRYSNGIAALKVLYDKADRDDTRAYILFALSYTGREQQFVLSKAEDLTKRVDQLNAYSLAILAIAFDRAGNHDQAMKALSVLKSKAVVSETYAYWIASEFEHGWCDNAVETAAYPLQAFLRLEPNSPLIPKIVRWLVDKRQGDRWYSTKDTAAAVIALMQYLETSNELGGQYSARFFLNEISVGELVVTPQNVWHLRKEVDLYSPTLRSGENQFRMEITGSGRLYFSGQLRYFENGKTVSAENKGIQLKREYFRFKRTVGRDNYADSITEALKGNVKIGDEILVKVSIEADHNYEYVILEDPLPSGFEVVTDPADQYDWIYWYCRREVRDEKVAFFSTWLWEQKREIYYIIRAEVPGSVQVSPAQSWTMYVPEIRGNTTGNFLTVVD